MLNWFERDELRRQQMEIIEAKRSSVGTFDGCHVFAVRDSMALPLNISGRLEVGNCCASSNIIKTVETLILDVPDDESH